MKLKNEALQKLYDRLVDGPISLSVYAGVLEKPFEEVDRELANLQNRNDILEKSNGTLLDLCSKNRDLKDRIRQLEKDRDIWVRNNGEKQAEIADLKNRLDKANYDRTALQQNLDYYMDIYKKVQDDYDELHRKYSECQGTVDKQAEQIRNLKAKQDGLREIGYEQGQTDLWEALQNVGDVKPWDISSFYPDVSSMDDIISWDMEDFLDEYKKWQEDIKKTYEQKETDRMREWLVDFCWGRVCEGCPLESKEYKCGCGYSFRKTGPSDLRIIPDKDIKRYYEKARGCRRYTVKDAKLFATTVEGVNRAITKACEGFCEAVRDADTKITENLRKGCTFEAEVKVDKDLFEKLCSIKSEEKKSKPGELVITTRGVTTANYSEATMNAIKEAVRKFEKSLPALDSWESTITGSIKVDDILGKTDGTEHKFEYGDAVRLPWRDYDYMYIGPYEESKILVRMFDPKMHAMVTSHIGNVKYNGGKIIICDEEDLRKIWKYKK